MNTPDSPRYQNEQARGNPLPQFNSRKMTLVECAIEDALYNPPYAVGSWQGRGSEDTGWGCTRPQAAGANYSRLWEYVVNIETYRAAAAADYALTKQVPVFHYTVTGVGFPTLH